MSNLQLIPVSQIEGAYSQKVEMRVPLYSYGCQRKIRKVLSHFKGLQSIDVDFYQQKVTVIGSVNRDQVLDAMKAKRKNTRFWLAEDGKPELDMTGGNKAEIMEYSMKPAAAASCKKTIKEHCEAISNAVFQKFQTTPYERAAWYADSSRDMSIGMITEKEEVCSAKLCSRDRKSISISVRNFIRKAVSAVITYCRKKDPF